MPAFFTSYHSLCMCMCVCVECGGGVPVIELITPLPSLLCSLTALWSHKERRKIRHWGNRWDCFLLLKRMTDRHILFALCFLTPISPKLFFPHTTLFPSHSLRATGHNKKRSLLTRHPSATLLRRHLYTNTLQQTNRQGKKTITIDTWMTDYDQNEEWFQNQGWHFNRNDDFVDKHGQYFIFVLLDIFLLLVPCRHWNISILLGVRSCWHWKILFSK